VIKLEYLLKNRKAILGVVGLGYVGLPLAVEKAKAGYRTIGFDIQKAKVEMVNKGINYIGDVVNEDLKEIVSKGLLSATSDFSEVAMLMLFVFVSQHH
jgi:UDP-N-acetyl-D-glucosamine dehydrogenase